MERRSSFRLTPVQLEQSVQRIFLCGHADLQRGNLIGARLSRFGSKAVKRLPRAARLFHVREISDPLHQPLLERLLGVTAGLSARRRQLLPRGLDETPEDGFPILLG